MEFFKDSIRHVDEQWRQAAQVLEELESAEAWKKVPPDGPYGSLNKLLLAEIGLSINVVRKQIGEARAVAMKAREYEGKTINSGRGPLTNEEKVIDDVIINRETGLGTSADYLTRRITRDHDDIAERMISGEFQSVRAIQLRVGHHARGTPKDHQPSSSPGEFGVLARTGAMGAERGEPAT